MTAWVKFWRTMPHFLKRSSLSFSTNCNLKQSIQTVEDSETADILSVEDNGIGVKKYNLPYIFQKGFTGDSTDSRKKATGMGLYLVKKMADDLNLHLEAASQWGKGFKIVIFFPKLRSNGGK